ncbi:hypothetical protein [Catellatospora sichuanensis]|uniref:hypothetical protein n=1 Tax=Catellatospora sichuanensis TaxID=1969805 RepID=UPI0011846650|nr:hypothetical protein [Catellatospora sichuanensis]
MARVVAVHGIHNTYGSPPQMAAQWIPALQGGVRIAALTGLVPDVDLADADVACVFYGDVFRPPGKYLGDVPPLDADDVDDGPELDLLMAWWSAAARMDSGVAAPDARTLGPRQSARAALLALSGSRFLARTTERLLVWGLKQVTDYFTKPAVRQAVQERFAAAVHGDTRVVVAHSLGSVVAYEALCAHPEWPVTDLVTLGSPLGVPHLVTHRLIPPTADWPAVERWTNITDSGDFVALRPVLRDVYGHRVRDIEIRNGTEAHKVDRYLSAAETGAAVATGILTARA